MGRNFFSVCHQCEVKLMHFRGSEGDLMQKFARVHSDHEKQTAVYNDYVEEPPEDYEDLENPTFIDSERMTEALKPKRQAQGTDLPSERSKPASGHLEAQSGAGEKGRL